MNYMVFSFGSEVATTIGRSM